jgi:uncharacterized protein (DUF2237 family)
MVHFYRDAVCQSVATVTGQRSTCYSVSWHFVEVAYEIYFDNLTLAKEFPVSLIRLQGVELRLFSP